MYIPPIFLWLIVAPIIGVLLFVLGLALLVWLHACWGQGAALVRRPLAWLARHGLPVEYAIPAGLALLPVGLVTLALLR